jgi:hypothetical protein
MNSLDEVQVQMDRLDAMQDRIDSKADLAQARMDRVQALVDAKVTRACERQRVVERMMRGDRVMRMVRMERATPVVVCPEQMRIRVPRVRVETPEIPAPVVQVEESHEPI